MDVYIEQMCERYPHRVVPLTEKSINHTTLTATLPFVREIASRVVYEKGDYKSGIVVIPDTKSFFSSREEAVDFQISCMNRLDALLSRDHPHTLLQQPSVIMSQDKERAYYSKTRRHVRHLILNGITSTKHFHTDQRMKNFASFCYGIRRNVVGGDPKFLYLDEVAEGEGIDNPDDLWRVSRLKDYTYVKGEIVMKLHKNLGINFNKYALRIEGLRWGRWPMIIFNNSRILHGASCIHKKDADKRSSRHIDYCAIGWWDPKSY